MKILSLDFVALINAHKSEPSPCVLPPSPSLNRRIKIGRQPLYLHLQALIHSNPSCQLGLIQQHSLVHSPPPPVHLSLPPSATYSPHIHHISPTGTSKPLSPTANHRHRYGPSSRRIKLPWWNTKALCQAPAEDAKCVLQLCWYKDQLEKRRMLRGSPLGSGLWEAPGGRGA
ncbi:hypothetical protein P154DRAFT_310458 [Amniculicola lignicola CBS 123094]|uniref:Uncharacterized protein n=1 Tax=Amniculicola lignicola CBS 123094 TaxID=1392246 RepID=A0A6A5W608_9PLEO|nr:hypothetical protein P154DRAFT_310458 [Amniculicola lignicola CBS 123094]